VGVAPAAKRAAERDDERLTTVGLLFESAAALRRVFEQRLEAEQSLSGQSFDVLIRLARSPGNQLRMSELAAQTSLTPSGLTRSVDRLRRQGLVDRRACPDDRRGAFAVLTPAGKELMDRAVPDHVDHVNEVLGDVFSPDEEAALASLLRRLRDQLYDRRAELGLEPGDVEACERGG
jgi:MarR family transcriptional regulator, 2-MHQ and catechol-resistance regulon repressor